MSSATVQKTAAATDYMEKLKRDAMHGQIVSIVTISCNDEHLTSCHGYNVWKGSYQRLSAVVWLKHIYFNQISIQVQATNKNVNALKESC